MSNGENLNQGDEDDGGGEVHQDYFDGDTDPIDAYSPSDNIGTSDPSEYLENPYANLQPG